MFNTSQNNNKDFAKISNFLKFQCPKMKSTEG